MRGGEDQAGVMVIGGGASWVCLGSSGEAPSLPTALSSFQRRVRQLGDVGDPSDGLGAGAVLLSLLFSH